MWCGKLHAMTVPPDARIAAVARYCALLVPAEPSYATCTVRDPPTGDQQCVRCRSDQRRCLLCLAGVVQPDHGVTRRIRRGWRAGDENQYEKCVHKKSSWILDQEHCSRLFRAPRSVRGGRVVEVSTPLLFELREFSKADPECVQHHLLRVPVAGVLAGGF